MALHFFGNATQNPLPPGGMPSGTPEQDKMYLHRRLGSWRVEMPLLIHKHYGQGCWPLPGMAGKINSAPPVPMPVKDKESSRNGSSSFTSLGLFLAH